jgi:hypothetical protein
MRESNPNPFSAWFFRAPDVVMIAMLGGWIGFGLSMEKRVTVLENTCCRCTHAAPVAEPVETEDPMIVATKTVSRRKRSL